MVTPNFPNRTLAVMDNLTFLRALDNECVDLIAIDPPFAANETFEGKVKPPITDAEIGEERALAARHGPDVLAKWEEYEGRPENQSVTRVKDEWFFRNVEQDWMGELRDVGVAVRNWDKRIEDGERPPAGDAPTARDRTLAAIGEVVEAVRAVATENEAAYIALMSVRLYECRRVLKETGSIYVHCDDSANAYLRMILNAIFGAENFRNEITWKRVLGGKNDAGQYGRNSDNILFYTKSAEFTFQPPRLPETNSSWYKNTDEHGAYVKRPLFAAGSTKGDSGQEWRGRAPSGHWIVPKLLVARYEREQGRKLEGAVRERLDILADAGYIEFSKQGNPSWRRYLSEANPPRVDDMWADEDVKPISRNATERTGYATQKPLALYRRIVRASSNPGDVVLDLFAGCATTVVAAEMEGRNWLACDMAYRASTMMMRRFYQNDIVLSNMNVDVVREAIGPHTGKMEYKSGRTIGPPDLAGFPRTTADPDEGTPDLRAPKRAPVSTSWNGSIPKDKAKEILLAEYGPKCWGCNFDASRPNGTINRSQLEVDHIQARKAADGVAGDDELDNLALLCAYCNRVKGNRMTLAELREKNAHDGVLYHVKTSKDLEPHEYAARRFAQRKMLEYARHG